MLRWKKYASHVQWNLCEILIRVKQLVKHTNKELSFNSIKEQLPVKCDENVFVRNIILFLV